LGRFNGFVFALVGAAMLVGGIGPSRRASHSGTEDDAAAQRRPHATGSILISRIPHIDDPS
jgi:hypothetical protein